MAYCQITDLLLGDMPVGTTNKQTFVDSAADEIDSVIGYRYQTPVDVTGGSPVSRPSKLCLKNINVWLATGRLVIAQAVGGEDNKLQEYGAYYLRTAMEWLQKIVDGSILIQGAPLAPGAADFSDGPVISNEDSVAMVGAFYNFAQPITGIYPPIPSTLNPAVVIGDESNTRGQ